MAKAIRSAAAVERRHLKNLKKLAEYLEGRERVHGLLLYELKALHWAINTLERTTND